MIIVDVAKAKALHLAGYNFQTEFYWVWSHGKTPSLLDARHASRLLGPWVICSAPNIQELWDRLPEGIEHDSELLHMIVKKDAEDYVVEYEGVNCCYGECDFYYLPGRPEFRDKYLVQALADCWLGLRERGSIK